MIVICNSSPLIALARIQKLDILKHLFGVVKTSTILKRAEKLELIDSYSDVMRELAKIMIYLP